MEKLMQFLPVNIEKLEKNKDMPGLVKTLKTHKDVNTRIKAAYALARIRDEASFEHLFTIFQSPGEPINLRSATALCIGEFKGDKAEDILIKGMKEEWEEIRANTLQALADFKTVKSIKAIVKALNDDSERVKNSAAASLGIGDPSSGKNLHEALNNAQDAVRAKAVKELAATRNKKVIEVLSIMIDDPDDTLRKRVIQALGAFESDQVIEPLLSRVDKEKGDTLSVLFTSIARIKNDKVIDILLEGLSQPRPEVKMACVQALCDKRSERSIDGLIPLILNPREPVELRSIVAKALGRIRGQKSLDVLFKVIDDDSDMYRTRIEEALIEMEHPELVLRLSALITSPKENLRRSAVKIMSRIKNNDAAIDPLLTLLSDPSDEIRGLVVMAMGELKSPKVIEALIHTLSNKAESPSVRGRAAQSLGRIKDDRAIPVLVESLKDESDYLRSNAVMALGGFKKSEALEALGQALSDSSESVKIYAADALAGTKDLKALDMLKKAEKDPSDRVRDAVSRALKSLGK